MNTTDNPEKPRKRIERSICVEHEVQARFPTPEFDDELGEYKQDEFGISYNDDGLPMEIPLTTFIDILNSVVRKYGDTICSEPKINVSEHYGSDVYISFETLETDEEYATRLKKEVAAAAAKAKREEQKLKEKLEREAAREKLKAVRLAAEAKAKEAAERRRAKRAAAKAAAPVITKSMTKKKSTYSNRW